MSNSEYLVNNLHFYESRASLIIFGENGFTIQGAIPSEDELEEIRIQSKKYMELIVQHKDYMTRVEIEHLTRQYEIKHPLETFWNKLLNRLKWLNN